MKYNVGDNKKIIAVYRTTCTDLYCLYVLLILNQLVSRNHMMCEAISSIVSFLSPKEFPLVGLNYPLDQECRCYMMNWLSFSALYCILTIMLKNAILFSVKAPDSATYLTLELSCGWKSGHQFSLKKCLDGVYEEGILFWCMQHDESHQKNVSLLKAMGLWVGIQILQL